MTVIAYLAPELPALSATFVYEELLALERRRLPVRAFAVHRAAAPVAGQQALTDRTHVLYDGQPLKSVLSALLSLSNFGSGAWRALRWLASDMLRVGLHRANAWKLPWQWLAGARLGQQLQRQGCTHLHVHFAHVPTQIAMYASAFTGIPFSVMAHANDIFERGLLLPQKAQRALKMMTISEFNRRHLLSVGVAASKLAVVRCGVSFAPRAVPARFEPKASYRIGTLGRLVEKKGVSDLLKAVAQLGPQPWQLQVSVVGDGPLRAELEALVASLGLTEQVSFEGALAHTEVSAWLQGLDVFVLACKADANGDMDGIPVVLMEAMSQCVPVLTTRLSGIPELVLNEQTGLLVSPGDPAALAAALARLLNAPTLRASLAEAALVHVEAEFGQSVNIDRLLGIIDPSASGAAASAPAAACAHPVHHTP